MYQSPTNYNHYSVDNKTQIILTIKFTCIYAQGRNRTKNFEVQNFFDIDTAGHLFLSSKYKNYLFSLLGTALTKI